MPFVTITGPILNSVGEPADGTLIVNTTAAFDTDEGYVSGAAYVVQVANGEPKLANSQPWSQIIPPAGQGIHVFEQLRAGGTTPLTGAGTTQRNRQLQVPGDVGSIEYGALVPIVSDEIGDFVIPPYVQTLLDGVASLPGIVAEAGGYATVAGAKALEATTKAAAAEQSRLAAEAAAAAAQVPTDTLNETLIKNPGSKTATALSAAFLSLVQAAKNPDMVITGAINRNGNGAITTASVKWPDGTPGTFTSDLIDASGAILGYHITYGSPPTKTFTQPIVTRNSDGAVTNLPAIVVS